MQFFELTHPAYKTDAEDDFYNPVRIVEDIKLPGLSCTACGATWAGSRRLYLPVRDAALRKRLSGPPLPEEEWKRLADAVRQDAELPQSFELMPGDVLGTPTVEL